MDKSDIKFIEKSKTTQSLIVKIGWINPSLCLVCSIFINLKANKYASELGVSFFDLFDNHPVKMSRPLLYSEASESAFLSILLLTFFVGFSMLTIVTFTTKNKFFKIISGVQNEN